MVQIVSAAEFLDQPGTILDVRSPGEYEQGHIPGAVSFPLFSNEERAAVGTSYKHEGKDAAVELGLALVGPKLHDFVRQAKPLAWERQIRVQCWRGGMRSRSMAWLLETAGLTVTVLQGGYKHFRQWGRSQLAQPKPIQILGGMTGTGKTATLHALATLGEQILDLEALANHRGSSYGALGLPAQPTTEQFENLIMVHWAKLSDRRPVWIEAESRQVGRCRIPQELFEQMEQAGIIELVRSWAERVAFLRADYGSADPHALIDATERIRKRLGGQRTQTAVEAIRQGDLTRAIEIVLEYYDKTYHYDLHRRAVPLQAVEVTGFSVTEAAQMVLASLNP
jgi:tRNA 2-selenouridine synthase